MALDHNNPEWWRNAVIYQIYPRSYQDTNNDGIGDLPGITKRLDYVAALGVDAIWISPFFKSPMKDFGYDVSDYQDVDPMFGTLDNFRTLLDKAHGLNLKVIVDLVMSHTADTHPWFIESRSSKNNPKADWYVWADPKADGTPPNNWLSIFGGSSWQFDVFRGQYYLHNFLKEQPDLNYNNPAVIDAMLEQMKFWLDFGVDGFRLDAVNFCTHDKTLRDNPAREDNGFSSQLEFKDVYSMQWHTHDKSRPENLDFMRKIRALLDTYPNRMAVAEIGDDFSTRVAAEYTASPDLLHTAYSFALMSDKGPMPGAALFRKVLEDQAAEPGESWPSWAFSNHDVVRAASRWSGSDYGHNPDQSKMMIALLISLRGTPFLYQGEELGLPEADIPYERILDPWGQYLYPKWKGRDGSRTPIPWNNDIFAGFSTTETWLPIPEEHKPLCVQEQDMDTQSVLNFTRKILAWRKDQIILQTGDITFIDSGHPDVLMFERHAEDKKIICLFNLGAKTRTISKTLSGWDKQVLILDNALETITAPDNGNVTLEPWGFCYFFSA